MLAACGVRRCDGRATAGRPTRRCVKFLVDAQLPARLSSLLVDAGHECVHMMDLPSGNRTADAVIARLADQGSRIVVTKAARAHVSVRMTDQKVGARIPSGAHRRCEERAHARVAECMPGDGAGAVVGTPHGPQSGEDAWLQRRALPDAEHEAGRGPRRAGTVSVSLLRARRCCSASAYRVRTAAVPFGWNAGSWCRVPVAGHRRGGRSGRSELSHSRSTGSQRSPRASPVSDVAAHQLSPCACSSAAQKGGADVLNGASPDSASAHGVDHQPGVADSVGNSESAMCVASYDKGSSVLSRQPGIT